MFFFKWANPGLFFVYFRSFSNKHYYNFYNRLMWKMSCPSSIRHRDSNPWSLDHEPPPITTRPGLPPWSIYVIAESFKIVLTARSSKCTKGNVKLTLCFVVSEPASPSVIIRWWVVAFRKTTLSLSKVLNAVGTTAAAAAGPLKLR